MPAPAFHDLSFEFENKPIHFTITQHTTSDLVVFSNIGRIGQIVEVIFPDPIVNELQRKGNLKRVEYESKQILGPDNVSMGYPKIILLRPSLNWKVIRSQHRFLSDSKVIVTSEKKKKTVFLPKTNFVNHVKSTERSAQDQHLAIQGGINSLYQWQRQQNRNKKFELLDGPPYANGVPHTGHAINKILKDFIVKSRILLGYEVRFRPGWDCHGLPIELKITKSVKDKTPVEIRELSREVASVALAKQMNSFKRWGVSADFENPYITMSKEYVAEQLRVFGEMIEKELVYRAFKPVYWSPSSRTALAESELEYNEKHESTSAYFRFKAIDLKNEDLRLSGESMKKPAIFYYLVWTSTPWTLPLNNAIAISRSSEYVAVQFSDEAKNPVAEIYIIAADMLNSAVEAFNRELKIIGTISGSALEGKSYRSCWYNELAQPILSADHVTMNMGTGLVHTSFAHGFQDYDVAKSRGIEVQSFVDEDGKYTRQMGHDLEGKFVMGAGQKEVLRLLKKDFIHVGKYIHSYPYDWRTKKPVIIRSSAQWFVNVDEVGKRASNLITGVRIGSGESDLSQALSRIINTRPSWCISRQRVWGTPIPCVIDETGTAHTSRELSCRVADLVEQRGPDAWWICSVEDILTDQVKASLNISSCKGLRKGDDIMDVWIDSGLAWYCARKNYEDANPEKPADAVLEGVDQFRGWFQSLLLTSTAVQNASPYNRVFVHGFCVDDNNKKMSKSIGNVVDPETITDGSLGQKALGADGLRLWVALAGAENAAESKIGNKALADVEKKMIAIRNSFRFILGACDKYTGKTPNKMPILDQYILNEAKNFEHKAVHNYREYKFRTVMNDFFQFTQKTLSTNYVSYVRDRLYCNALNSDEHISAQYTLHRVGLILAHIISPILPHLSAEFLQHLPHCEQKEILRTPQDVACNVGSSFDPQLQQIVGIVTSIRTVIAEKSGPKIDLSKMGLLLNLTSQSYEVLKQLQLSEKEFHSELCELFGVSAVVMKESSTTDSIDLFESDGKHCERCRKLNRVKGTHCDRCTLALQLSDLT